MSSSMASPVGDLVAGGPPRSGGRAGGWLVVGVREVGRSINRAVGLLRSGVWGGRSINRAVGLLRSGRLSPM
ncbi:hypothetical protein AB0K67_14885 [Nonomuraea sp. NPDC052634]|uniref:hypothetical protein n=1 Tax=Nonomuraea sp. NPDC052634 TaxID=3155813 RepID=UPI003438C536